MRKLKAHELPVVEACFKQAGLELSDHIRVEEMEDGGMGSLLFRKGASITRYGIAECHFKDEDGVLVSVSLNATDEGAPVELDIWKVDYSPLERWPNIEEITIGPPNKALQPTPKKRRG
ncbi:MAG: hypothetical protein WBO32_03855 [Cyclobacteriaceae bacterium]